MANNENKQIYSYQARTQTGSFIEGKIKAQTTKEVASLLITKGYIPLEIKAQTALQKDISFSRGTVKPKDVAQVARQFATLNEAGIPITRTLDILRDQQQNPTFKAALAQVRKDIDTGSTLGAALEKHPTIFTPLTTSMIKAGEAGGFLTHTLRTVAETLESDVRLKGKIKSALTYPVAVLILAALLVTAMLLFIVPIFADLFAGFGSNLPAPTQLLVSASEFLKVGGVPTVIVIIVFVFWWNKNKHKQKVREFVDPIKLKVPIFGKLIQKITVARFSQNFGALLSAGLPLMQTLDIVGSTSGSTVLEEALTQVKHGVSQGELIAPQLAKHAIFPKMLTEMVAVGEDAGEIPDMMEKISISYKDDVDTMTESLSSLLEPIMLMVLGVVVGGCVICLYLPIFSIYDLIGT